LDMIAGSTLPVIALFVYLWEPYTKHLGDWTSGMSLLVSCACMIALELLHVILCSYKKQLDISATTYSDCK